MIDPTSRKGLPGVLLALLLQPALATEYSLEYGLEASYEYNDNINLRPDVEIDVTGGRLKIPVTLRSRSERLDASMVGDVSISEFNESAYDSDDYNVLGQVTYQLERGEVSGNAGYRQDSTVNSEFLDTGVVGLGATRRKSASASGSGFQMFTEKNGISGGVDYSNVEYGSERYQNYDYVSGNAGWIHQWSELTTLRLQAFGGRYENKSQTKISSNSTGIQAGFDYQLAEQLSASLLAGWVKLKTDYSANLPVALDNDDSDGLVATGSLKYVQERYELQANIKSQPSPSGNGYMLYTHQLDLNWRYRLTERSRFAVSLIGGRNESVDSRINNDRDYARCRLRLDYRFSPAWHIAGTYVYSWQDRSNFPDDANSNAMYLSLIFQPQKAFWSR